MSADKSQTGALTKCRPASSGSEAGLRVRAKITCDFGGSAAGSDARRVGESVSSVILDRPRNNADDPAPPRPGGLRGFGSLASLLLGQRPLRVSSLVEPRQRAKSSAAKSEFIFARTLRSSDFSRRPSWRHSHLNATAGSTRVARCAGNKLARNAMITRTAVTAANISGSRVLIPYISRMIN